MNKTIMLVELWELINEASNIGFEVDYMSKGREWSRELLNVLDIERFVNYDIVLLETTQKKAESLRQKMQLLKKKETIICWCMWYDFWRNNGGEYQITTIDKSFNDCETIDAKNPSFELLEAVFAKLESEDNEESKTKRLNNN